MTSVEPSTTARPTSPMDAGRLRNRVRAGEFLVGTFVGTGSPGTAEVCAAAGLDWLVLDLEHGAGGEEQVAAVVPVTAAYGVPTVVRVETSERIRLGRVLDLGAAGVMLPRLENVADVRQAVTHMRYPPRGDRGVATYNRACRFGLDVAALDTADESVLTVVQIESGLAVQRADDIAALDGVDVLFVGPRDLSHDLGVPGDVTADAFVRALDTVQKAAARHGKACGLLVGDGESAARRRAEGWTFVAIGSDSALLAQAISHHSRQARSV